MGIEDRRRPKPALEASAHVWRAAEDGLSRVAGGGAASYDRRRALPRLIGCDPRDLDRNDETFDRAIRVRLTRALRAERRRGRAGHSAYDLDRHIALLRALDAEAARDGAGAARRPASRTR